MPTSRSSVRGLTRTLELDLDADPRDDPESMMRRVDRDEVRAVCRHLLGRLPEAGALDHRITAGAA